MSRTSPQLLITDFAGLARRSALLAVGMTVFMISLAGVPPTGGFWAKILIFRAAIDRGGSLGVWLAVIMLVNSVISIFYYFAVPRQMIFKPAVGRVAPGRLLARHGASSAWPPSPCWSSSSCPTRSRAWRTSPPSSTDPGADPASRWRLPCEVAVSRTAKGRRIESRCGTLVIEE